MEDKRFNANLIRQYCDAYGYDSDVLYIYMVRLLLI